jgi:diguanylate cyclase (GGDEF)-like protein
VLKTLRPELISKCLELIYFQASNAYASSIAGGIVLAVLFWNRGQQAAIVAWAVAYGIMIAIRHRLGVRFRAAPRNPADALRWLRYFAGVVFICGVIWGAYGVYLAREADTFRLAAVILTLAALMSGAVTAYSVSMFVFLSFSIPTMVPLGGWLALSDSNDRRFLGVLVFIWLIFMSFSARRFRNFAVESLGHQFDNVNLVRSLAAERDKAKELAEQLAKLSTTDSLTGVANRRCFDTELLTVLDDAKQRGTPLTLILCDVDFFKLYNDAYGHIQGDVCLRSVAAQLASVAALHGALAARIGGEEFAVVWRDAPLERGIRLAEELRAAVEKLGLKHEKSQASHYVTGSFGVYAEVPTANTTCSDLLKAADEALYQAKRAGRNRVCDQHDKIARVFIAGG